MPAGPQHALLPPRGGEAGAGPCGAAHAHAASRARARTRTHVCTCATRPRPWWLPWRPCTPTQGWRRRSWGCWHGESAAGCMALRDCQCKGQLRCMKPPSPHFTPVVVLQRRQACPDWRGVPWPDEQGPGPRGCTARRHVPGQPPSTRAAWQGDGGAWGGVHGWVRR